MGIATMVTMEVAERETGASIPHIRRLIALGLLQEARNLERDILIPLNDLKRLETISEGVDLSEIEGNAIHIAEASRRYGFSTSSLSRWYRKGYIRKVGEQKNRILLNEADVLFVKLVTESEDLKPGQDLGIVLKRL